MGGLLPHFFVVKIKGEDETLEAWNFILKLFKPSYVDLIRNLFGSSAARSLDIGYSYGSQPKKYQNDVFLENRVPNRRISLKISLDVRFDYQTYPHSNWIHTMKLSAIFTPQLFSCHAKKTSSLRSVRKIVGGNFVF